MPTLLLAYGQPDCTPEEVAAMMQQKRMAFERIRSGSTSDGDKHELAELANLLVILSENVPDLEVRALIESVGKEAQHAVLRALDREKYGFDGDGAAAMLEALDMFEQILPLCKPAHLVAALGTMLQRGQSGQFFKNTK